MRAERREHRHDRANLSSRHIIFAHKLCAVRNLIVTTDWIAINGLVAGASNSNGMLVTVNTSTAGTINGTIGVNFTSAGAVNNVSNGLGSLAVGSAALGVSGTINTVANVINTANPVVNNAPINLGNVRINSASPTAFVNLTNQTMTLPQAALNATIAGNAQINASGKLQPAESGRNEQQQSAGRDEHVDGGTKKWHRDDQPRFGREQRR